ncbi:MAG: DUF1328 domain-containing protein [Hyphomicrobiales bacterium]|nr:DUF1328 domain-containing protein [Hyphomicrobiales bacterium]
MPGNLLHYGLVFLVIAIIAAIFGFGGVAGTAMAGAKILFWVAIVLMVLSFLFGAVRRRS